MIGCPLGLYIRALKLPIVRKGISANRPYEVFSPVDADGVGHDDVGIVDIASFHGSSGSPLLVDETMITQNINITGSLSSAPKKLRVVGVLCARPNVTANTDLCQLISEAAAEHDCEDLALKFFPELRKKIGEAVARVTNPAQQEPVPSVAAHVGYYVKSYRIHEMFNGMTASLLPVDDADPDAVTKA